MVSVLPVSTMRNFCVYKAIFNIIRNAEMGWESHIMSTEKLCFLSEQCHFSAEPFLCASSLSEETKKLGSSGAMSCAQG